MWDCTRQWLSNFLPIRLLALRAGIYLGLRLEEALKPFEAGGIGHRSLGYFGGPKGLAPLVAPGVFMYQMTDPALRGLRVGFSIVQRLHLRYVAEVVKGAMNVTTLAVLGDDAIIVFRG
jgi:hypothetical protein